ncbi:hypothetical protein RGQ29_018664 [Quercus rubra]|uniref:Uncharacterized protein n=1 Tax=Quercus rubra TaxID=3512 RepID=A0AAN7FJ22_QUERU|nr:hypothetical protein RGQ29_018664 [Quercus rubra]
MVSELLPNWTIFAKKVLTPKYSMCRTCNSCAHYSHKLSPQISTLCGQFSPI